MQLFKKADEDSRPQILIAEDDEMQAARLQTILEHNGYRVIVAVNGREALSLLSKSTPVLVITDIMLPEMDGYTLCQSIKENERTKTLPVIMMTSLSDANDVVRGLYSGADGLIAKPYDEQFLLRRVENILSNRQMRATAEASGESGREAGIRLSIGGKKHFVTPERLQVIDMLLSSYEIAVQKESELRAVKERLEQRERELAEARQIIARQTAEPDSGAD